MVKSGPSLKSFLEKYPVFRETDYGKLLCTITNHELPISQIENYVKTKKFLLQWGIHDVLQKYGEHFQELGKDILACNLTKRSVSRDAKALTNHVNGTRFKKALEEFKKAKLESENEKMNDSTEIDKDSQNESLEETKDISMETDDVKLEVDDGEAEGKDENEHENKSVTKKRMPAKKKRRLSLKSKVTPKKPKRASL